MRFGGIVVGGFIGWRGLIVGWGLGVIKGRRLVWVIYIWMVNSWVFELDMNVLFIMCYYYGLLYVYFLNVVDFEVLICYFVSVNVGVIVVGGIEFVVGVVGVVVGGDGVEVGCDFDVGDGIVLVVVGGVGVVYYVVCCGGVGVGGCVVVGGLSFWRCMVSWLGWKRGEDRKRCLLVCSVGFDVVFGDVDDFKSGFRGRDRVGKGESVGSEEDEGGEFYGCGWRLFFGIGWREMMKDIEGWFGSWRWWLFVRYLFLFGFFFEVGIELDNLDVCN